MVSVAATSNASSVIEASGGPSTSAAASAENYQLTELKNVSSDVDGEGEEVRNDDVEEVIETFVDQKCHVLMNENVPEADYEEHVEGEQAFTPEEEYQLQIIDAIHDHPCLYDASDPHFGNTAGNAAHRARAWQAVGQRLTEVYQEPPYESVEELKMQWSTLRSEYVERRKEKDVDLCGPVMDAMRWLDAYLDEHLAMQQQPPQLAPRDMYYTEGPALEQDVMISGQGYQDHHDMRQALSSRPVGQSAMAMHEQPQGNAGYYIMRPSNSGNERVPRNTAVRVVSTGPQNQVLIQEEPHHSGTMGHMRGSVNAVHGRSRVQMVSSSQHQPAGVHHYMEKVSVNDPGVTVTASGHSAMAPQLKKGDNAGTAPPMTMILDTSSVFTTGSQKVYRLVNVADSGDHASGPPSKKRIALVPTPRHAPSQQQHQVQQAQPQQHHVVQHAMSQQQPSPQVASMNSPVFSSAPGTSRGQLGDDIILDDGIDERTVVIEQEDEHLLSDSPGPGTSMMISGHTTMAPRMSGPGGPHQRMLVPSNMMGGPAVGHSSRMPSTPGLMESAAGYVHQSQYDADLQFQQFISSHLSRLNEDEKAIAKLNIQRILLDARFGEGTSARIMVEDDEMRDVVVGPSSVVGQSIIDPQNDRIR